MTKQLFEEALADVKKVKQVAEDNAKRAILEAVTPRIRDFIDRALLEENDEDGFGSSPILGTGEVAAAPGMPEEEGELLTDLVDIDPNASVHVDSASSAAAITPPDADGKVTLDIDALCSSEPGASVEPPMFGTPALAPEEAEYEINLESIDALKPVISNTKKPADASDRMIKINEAVSLLGKASKVVRSTPTFKKQIAQMICQVEDMYDYVQEQVTDLTKKNKYEIMLEANFKNLNKLQELTTMSKKIKHGQMNEADVTLKLTGLPDDIDLDTVGVDLITGEEEEGSQDVQDDGDMDDLDMGSDQDFAAQDGEEQQMETRRLSDDTIVEIDETMLRREIARMRNLREEAETKADSWGNGPGDDDAFGGGSKAGDPGLDSLAEADEDELDESDDQDDLDESDDQDQDDLDEADGMDQIGNRLKKDEFGGAVADGHETQTWDKRHSEGVKRLNFEKKLQERAKARASALKKEAAVAQSRKNVKRFNEIKKEYQVNAKRFNESVARADKMTQLVAEAAKKIQESRSNSVTARPAGNTAENANLRKKLAETNLFNAKLLFTNKLLQNEQLTSRQKAQVIKQLDSAKTVREAKLVYESLANTLAGNSKPVNENRERQVIGSSSRTTRPASTINEGYEAERWAQLAGITKR